MSEAKHTPGTWRICHYTNYIGYSVHAGDRGCIAERWYDSPQNSPYRDEICANAKLIAAAPNLLAACQMWADRFPHRDGEPGPDHHVDAQMLEITRAAIARATT